MSLDETASMLKTTIGAVKSALHRGRSRINQTKPSANFSVPDRSLVESFMQALAEQDLEKLQSICSVDLKIELVGGAESDSFEQGRNFFKNAHMVLPAIGFGSNPHWQLVEYEGEAIVLGYRTLHGMEGINEIHRIEALDEVIVRVRCYCFCPDTLHVVAEKLGKAAIQRNLSYRSPALVDIPGLLLHNLWRKS